MRHEQRRRGRRFSPSKRPFVAFAFIGKYPSFPGQPNKRPRAVRRKRTDFQRRVDGNVAIEFSDEGMTSYAGLELLIHYLRRIGFNTPVATTLGCRGQRRRLLRGGLVPGDPGAVGRKAVDACIIWDLSKVMVCSNVFVASNIFPATAACVGGSSVLAHRRWRRCGSSMRRRWLGSWDPVCTPVR